MTTQQNTLPKEDQISLLADAINCDNPEAARLLIRRAMSAIHSHKSWQQPAWNDQDLDAVLALIKGFNPRDTVETMLAAQFVALHLQATANMAQENYNTMSYALMMVRLSHQTLDMLQRYRGKGQNINVNYNVLNHGNAILNTVIKDGGTTKKDE